MSRPTQRQLDLIRELLEELGWSGLDIEREVGVEYGNYEELDPDLTSELIDALIQEKRSRELEE